MWSWLSVVAYQFHNVLAVQCRIFIMFLLKSGYHSLGSPFLFKNIYFDFQYFIIFLAIILKIFYKTLDTCIYLFIYLYHKTTTK